MYKIYWCFYLLKLIEIFWKQFQWCFSWVSWHFSKSIGLGPWDPYFIQLTFTLMADGIVAARAISMFTESLFTFNVRNVCLTRPPQFERNSGRKALALTNGPFLHKFDKLSTNINIEHSLWLVTWFASKFREICMAKLWTLQLKQEWNPSLDPWWLRVLSNNCSLVSLD